MIRVILAEKVFFLSSDPFLLKSTEIELCYGRVSLNFSLEKQKANLSAINVVNFVRVFSEVQAYSNITAVKTIFGNELLIKP